MSMSDQMILRGRVGTGVTLRRAEEGGRSFARFRMVVTRSRRKDDGQWEDGEPQWHTVRAWGALAEHLHVSFHKGQPIVVVGRPAVQAWISRDGELRSELAVNAITAGHDLGLGVGMFSRVSAMVGGQSAAGGLASSDQPLNGNLGGEEDAADSLEEGAQAIQSAVDATVDDSVGGEVDTDSSELIAA